jgi:hypothetical protein
LVIDNGTEIVLNNSKYGINFKGKLLCEDNCMYHKRKCPRTS